MSCRFSRSSRVLLFGLLLTLSCSSGLPAAQGAPKPKPPAKVYPVPEVPVFNSYPQAKEVIYLRFNGSAQGTLPYSGKPVHGKDDDPRDFNAEELEDIRVIWARVADKMCPFPVNVTTDRKHYDYAAEHGINRTICTFSAGHRGASWSALWFCWAQGGTCSIAPRGTIFGIVSVAGHELGHSMGMDHDNSPLVRLGTKTWGPMFSGGNGLCQWSKNEVLHCDYARRQRDALEIITSQKNKIGYRVDDHGNQAMTASLLRPGKTRPAGIIERNTDVDVFRFTTTGGPVAIDIRPPDFRPATLNVLAELYDSKGKRLLVSDPQGDDFGASLAISDAPSGTYYVHVSGTGQGTPGVDGFSDYGSLGRYFIDAKFKPAPTQRDVVHGLTGQLSVTSDDPPPASPAIHKGLLQVPAEGMYTFHLKAMSKLFIRRTLVVSHDGTEGEKTGEVFLAAGLQPIRFEWPVPLGPLPIEYAGPGVIRKAIPALVLYPYPATATRPIAKEDAYTVLNSELRVLPPYGVLANDSDYDGDAMRAQLVDNVRHGTLALKPDGSFVYTPDDSLTGGAVDQFTYRVSDGKNRSKVATVKLAVWGPRVDFRQFKLANYTGIGLPYGARVEDEGRTLRLNASDPAKKIFLPYNVTPETVLAFDFHGVTEGKYHQIGFINNTVGVDPNRLFRVWGVSGRRGAHRFEAIGSIKSYINGSGSYVIPVGKHFTGPTKAICFGNWGEEKGKNDAGDPGVQNVKRVAECTFSNVRIYESDDPNYSYTSTPKAVPPLPRPKGIRVVHGIQEAFAQAKFQDRGTGYEAEVPLDGIFSGRHDDFFLRFEIVKDLGLSRRSSTKLKQDNAGKRLVFSLPKHQSMKGAAFVLRVTDGESNLEYRCAISWDPKQRRLTAKTAAK